MTATIAEQEAAPPLIRKRWTTEEFDRLIQSDVFAGRDRFALIDGEVVTEGQAATVSKRWTIGEVDQLVREGILREGSSEFLWDGEIITPMPEYPPHSNACDNLADLFRSRLPRDMWTISPNHPLELSETFMPEPDLIVARGPRSNYRKARPTATDAALVVEVASTSYKHDAGTYLRQYARTGIPLYWIIHLKYRRIEVYSSPITDEARFEHRADYGMDEMIPMILDATFEYEAIAVEAILRDSMEA